MKSVDADVARKQAVVDDDALDAGLATGLEQAVDPTGNRWASIRGPRPRPFRWSRPRRRGRRRCRGSPAAADRPGSATPCCRHALLRKRELLGGERHAREGGAKFGGGHLGQRAPAAADLQHAVAPGCTPCHAQGAAHLGMLGLAHVAARIALEPGGRIVHRVVQPQRVKRVAQVVVGMDVFLAVGARVAVEQVLDAVQQPPGPGAVDHAFDLLAVGDEKLEQVGEVRCGPVARDVAFGKPDIARLEGGCCTHSSS
jgi:hypothetical protein